MHTFSDIQRGFIERELVDGTKEGAINVVIFIFCLIRQWALGWQSVPIDYQEYYLPAVEYAEEIATQYLGYQHTDR